MLQFIEARAEVDLSSLAFFGRKQSRTHQHQRRRGKPSGYSIQYSKLRCSTDWCGEKQLQPLATNVKNKPYKATSVLTNKTENPSTDPVIAISELVNELFADIVDYQNYRLMTSPTQFNNDVPTKPHMMIKKAPDQMKNRTFNCKELLQIITFLHKFKVACDACNIDEGAKCGYLNATSIFQKDQSSFRLSRYQQGTTKTWSVPNVIFCNRESPLGTIRNGFQHCYSLAPKLAPLSNTVRRRATTRNNSTLTRLNRDPSALRRTSGLFSSKPSADRYV